MSSPIWTLDTLTSAEVIYDVCWAPELGKYCATGSKNGETVSLTLTSIDGINWTEHTISPFLFGISWSGTKFVGVGFNAAFSSKVIYRSSDGITWTNVTPGFTVNFSNKAIAYGNATFVIVGPMAKAIYSIDDGANWLQSNNMPTSTDWRCIAYFNRTQGSTHQLFVAASPTIIAYSSDGITWFNGLTTSSRSWSSIAVCNTIGQTDLLVISSYPTTFPSSETGVTYLTSLDGQNFTIHNNVTPPTLNSSLTLAITWTGVCYASAYSSQGSFVFITERQTSSPITDCRVVHAVNDSISGNFVFSDPESTPGDAFYNVAYTTGNPQWYKTIYSPELNQIIIAGIVYSSDGLGNPTVRNIMMGQLPASLTLVGSGGLKINSSASSSTFGLVVNPSGGIKLNSGATGEEFVNLVLIGSGGIKINSSVLEVLSVDVSGIYTIVKDKTNDTLYDRLAGSVTTEDFKIPDPFIKTGFIG